MVARCERKRSNDLMAASRDSEAVIDSELFSRGNPRFCPPPQIVSHWCFSDSVNSVEQPCREPPCVAPHTGPQWQTTRSSRPASWLVHLAVFFNARSIVLG